MNITENFELRRLAGLRHLDGLTLADLRNEARWCAWTLRLREAGGSGGGSGGGGGSSGGGGSGSGGGGNSSGGGGRAEKPTKIGVGVGQRFIRSNDPTTWLRLTDAAITAGLLPRPYDLGGVGIMLGDLGPQWGSYWLIGVDLDNCLDASGMAPWAIDVLAALGGIYCEESPSGKGLKFFMLMTRDDVVALRQALHFVRPWSRSWKYLKANDDGPSAGIEVHTGNRWYAVTGEGSRPLGIAGQVEIEALRGAVGRHFPDKGEWLAGGGAGGDIEVTDVMIKDVGALMPDEMDELTAGEQTLLARLGPRIQAHWDRLFVLNDDKSNSAAAWNMAGDLRRAGVAIEVAIPLLLKCPWVREYYQNMGEWEGRRQVARWWWRHNEASVSGNRLEGVAPAITMASAITLTGTVADTPAADTLNVDASGVLDMVSEGAIARWVVDDHRHEIRHVKARGDWFVFDGTRWAPDSKSKVHRMVHNTCIRVACRPSVKGAMIPRIMAGSTTAAVERLARSDPRVAADTNEWDANPWLLNTPSGAIDLKTGKLGPNDHRHMMTKVTPVGLDREGVHPHWSKFLSQVTDGDLELEAYLRRVAGYCLTGITTEQEMFFLHGGGSNGKGTFVGVLLSILGVEGYAQNVPPELFLARRAERHSAELARLCGARLVVTSETEEGKSWNESRIKDVTGGGPITAQFMRQNYFTFIPEFKLVVSGNHKPRITSVNDAIRRRMNLIPFNVSFKNNQDKDLVIKLHTELDQILAWAVRGCLEWQASGGLKPSKKVIEATEAYMREEDSKMIWFEECCEKVDTRHETRETDLFASWTIWASRSGELTGSQKSLGEWLRNSRFELTKNANKQIVCRGVILKNRLGAQVINIKP